MISVKKANLKGKKVLLRVDINSDVVNKKVLFSERIKESAASIKFLKNKKARVVILAHQGRKGKKDFTSLKQHAKFLNKYTKVKFVEDILGKKAETEISNLKNGQAILLENVRGLKEEFQPGKNKLTEKLSSLCDVYVNDAFSVCHRKQTSIVSFPKYLKSYAGINLEKEINALKKIKLKNCLYILGGAKPEDNIKLLKENKVLSCGLFGQACLIAKGKKLGAQEKYLKNKITDFEKIKKKLKPKLKKVLMPKDFAVKISKKRVELKLEQFPSQQEIFDIGEETIKEYKEQIKKAKTIFMKGPAGDCADKNFCKGTNELLKTISKKQFSLIGGGHLNDAIQNSKIPKKKFNHISLSGGALLSFISGEKLPGIEALK